MEWTLQVDWWNMHHWHLVLKEGLSTQSKIGVSLVELDNWLKTWFRKWRFSWTWWRSFTTVASFEGQKWCNSGKRGVTFCCSFSSFFFFKWKWHLWKNKPQKATASKLNRYELRLFYWSDGSVEWWQRWVFICKTLLIIIVELRNVWKKMCFSWKVEKIDLPHRCRAPMTWGVVLYLPFLLQIYCLFVDIFVSWMKPVVTGWTRCVFALCHYSIPVCIWTHPLDAVQASLELAITGLLILVLWWGGDTRCAWFASGGQPVCSWWDGWDPW